VIWPGECFDQFGRTSTCLEPHAEQRNLPFTAGNGVVGLSGPAPDLPTGRTAL
jgi:hypothetical protein